MGKRTIAFGTVDVRVIPEDWRAVSIPEYPHIGLLKVGQTVADAPLFPQANYSEGFVLEDHGLLTRACYPLRS